MKEENLTKRKKSIIGVIVALILIIAAYLICYFHKDMEEISIPLIIIVIIMVVGSTMGILAIYLANEEDILDNFD